MNAATRPPPSRTTFVAIPIALIALVWCVFGQTLRHEFINYDDPAYVYENPAITGGLTAAGVRWAFTHIHAQNWHPVTTLTHMLDCQAWGLAPFGHHLTNVALHSLAAALLFVALNRLTGSTWRSAFVAAVFAIHPLRVESVAWIAERKDVLSGLFFMLTLWSYAAYARRGGARRFALVALFFALGAMAKPMLVTVPFVLLLLDYWPLRRLVVQRGTLHRLNWKTLGEKLPLLAISAGSSYATLLAQRQYIGVGEILPLSARLTNAALSYLMYVRQLVWPTGLAPFYPHRESTVPLAEIAIVVAVLVVVTVLAFVFRKRAPFGLVGWLWYVGMLVPVIGVVQVGWQSHADRYTYLPHIGLCIGIVWALGEAVQRLRIPTAANSAINVSVIGALSVAAFVQTTRWRDSETLWKHTLAVMPDNDVAQNNLGIVLLARGKMAEAESAFETALRLRPDNVVAHTNLANVLIQRGEIRAGIAHAQRAVELEPANADAGNLYGFVLLQQGDTAGAVAQWKRTHELNPENGNACSNLAWVYATHPSSAFRDGAAAVRLAEKARELSGGKNALVLRTLAAAYAESGQFEKAIAAAREARAIAAGQGNSALVAELDATIGLYESGTALRDPSLAAGGANQN